MNTEGLNILIVEDDPVSRMILETGISRMGYTVFTADDGLDAWEKIDRTGAEMIITDWMMDRMDGSELCRRIRSHEFGRYIYVIMVSALDSRDKVAEGLEAGADDYLAKPVDMLELKARVRIGERIVSLERQGRRRYRTIRKNYFQTIQMFGNLIEVFNESLGGHSRRVAELAVWLAREHPDIPDDEIEMVRTAGLLHDVGMVGFPAEILFKRWVEMSGEERTIYRSHPERGEHILNEIEMLRPVSYYVRTHHEQYNGRGFPDGLRGDAIPAPARVISAASIYDSLVNKWRIPLVEIPANLERRRGYELEPLTVNKLIEFNTAAIRDEEAKTYSEVGLDEVEEGMVLAAALRGTNGMLLMPAQSRLSSHGIEKLRQFRELGWLPKQIRILKTSVRG